MTQADADPFWVGPEWMRDARWVGRGTLEDPVPMREEGIPADGPWLAGAEPGVTPQEVLAFVQSYNARMHPLYYAQFDDEGRQVLGPAPDYAERQAALRAQCWRRTDRFHLGAVLGDGHEYDPAVSTDWCADRLGPRTWQVTWATPMGPLGAYTQGVVVVVFDDGPRIVDLLEERRYHGT